MEKKTFRSLENFTRGNRYENKNNDFRLNQDMLIDPLISQNIINLFTHKYYNTTELMGEKKRRQKSRTAKKIDKIAYLLHINAERLREILSHTHSGVGSCWFMNRIFFRNKLIVILYDSDFNNILFNFD